MTIKSIIIVAASVLVSLSAGQDWTEFWATFDENQTQQEKITQANQDTWTRDSCTALDGVWEADSINGNKCYTYEGPARSVYTASTEDVSDASDCQSSGCANWQVCVPSAQKVECLAHEPSDGEPDVGD